MNKRKVVLVGIIIAALCFTGFVYALYYTTVSWTQTLQVPAGSFTAYYGATEINQTIDQASIWTWYNATSSFNTTITIKNVGVSTINVAVAYLGLNPLWTPNGAGTQTSIAVGETRLVNLSINNTSAHALDFVGPFNVTMTIVP